jgi:tRNA uridine 5-carbamoylmethylation protein Kti12
MSNNLRSKPKLIALTGPKGVGKSTYAKFLAGENGVVMSFASPIKDMLRVFIKDEYIDTHKEELIPHIGTTARTLLQTLGTEWGRDTINPDIWVNVMRRKLCHGMFNEYHPVIIDDLRFKNEAEMVRQLDGEVWKVARKGFDSDATDKHISEAGLPDWDKSVLL